MINEDNPQVTFLDPNVPRKSSIVDEALAAGEDRFPLPSVVEVSESGTCNRQCVFCPRSAPDFPDIKEFIDPGLIDKLAGQLGDAGFRGIFLFSGFVEPMLDKNIYELVRRVREYLPNSRVEMVTNGDVLNEARLRRLVDSGLSTLLISAYDSQEQAEEFEAMCRRARMTDEQFVVRHRYLPPEDDFGITLSNRAGTMESAEYTIPIPDEPLKVPCHYPHYTFFMDYLGDVLMCPHDWGKRLIVGNMKKQDFMEIWLGRKMTAARKRLARADRNFGPCRTCDVKGMLMGRKHVEAWEAVYAETADAQE